MISNREIKKNIYPTIGSTRNERKKNYEDLVVQNTFINYSIHRDKPIYLEIFNSIQKQENQMFYSFLQKREKFHKKNETISYNNEYKYKRYESSKKIRDNTKEILDNIKKVQKKYTNMNSIKSKNLNDYSVLSKFYNKLVFNKI